MKTKHIIPMAALVMTSLLGCQKTTDQPLIGKQEIQIEGGRLTPEALWAMGVVLLGQREQVEHGAVRHR